MFGVPAWILGSGPRMTKERVGVGSLPSEFVEGRAGEMKERELVSARLLPVWFAAGGGEE